MRDLTVQLRLRLQYAATITVRTGARCQVHISGRSTLSDSTVSRPPQHGTAFAEGHGFGYRPQPGYAGSDAFAITLTGTTYRKGRSSTYAMDGTTEVDFAVQVLR